MSLRLVLNNEVGSEERIEICLRSEGMVGGNGRSGIIDIQRAFQPSFWIMNVSHLSTIDLRVDTSQALGENLPRSPLSMLTLC